MEVGELLYECTLKITELIEFGTSLEDMTSGKAPMPPQGVRFDAAVTGTVTGDKLKGTVKGIDYLKVRADGRMDIDLRGQITTEDGRNISLTIDGACVPRKGSPVSDLRENVTVFSAHPDYAWLNPLQVWSMGTLDLSTRVINLKAYLALKQ